MRSWKIASVLGTLGLAVLIGSPWAHRVPEATAPAVGRDAASFRLRRVAIDPAGGGDATLAPDGRRFLTTSRRSGNWDLWSFDLATGAWQRLTDDPADDYEGRFSPDGRRIVFTSTRSGHKNVWVMDAATRVARRLTFSQDEDEYPAWSPDGSSIVYTGGPWTHRDFFLVPSAGGTPRRLTRESGWAGACTFEPRGDSLVCHRYDLGSGDVIRLFPDGEMAPLTIGPAWDYKPSASPDGAWLAFSRSEDGPAHVAVMPAAGGRVRTLTQSPYDDRWPTWSGTGHTLLFHRIVDQGTGLALLDRASGRARLLVGPEERPLQGSLDPRGERVVYCAQLPDRKVLKMREIANGATSLLDTGPGEACWPRWSPDGSRIAYVGKSGVRWEVSVIAPDGGGRTVLTAGLPDLHGMDGPIDWSPDGSRLLFHADTTPYAADIYVLNVATRELTDLTHDRWFSEAPSWTPDGRGVLFMSTRGGDWTWGLFRLNLADGAIETVSAPNWVEKNFPRMDRAGTVVWSTYDEQGVEHLAERDPGGAVRRVDAAGPRARWPSPSADGRSLLYTTVEHRVEFWLAENVFGPGSPLGGVARAEVQTGAGAANVRALQERRERPDRGRSPSDLERR
jgi:TolB protein